MERGMAKGAKSTGRLTDGQCTVPIGRLKLHPLNPRSGRDWDLSEEESEALGELAESIKRHGILEPLVVTPDGTIIVGSRRFIAAEILAMENPVEIKVPVIVRSVPDAEAVALMLVENMQRASLTPIEEADAYMALRKAGLSLGEMSERTLKDSSFISGRLGQAMKALGSDTKAVAATIATSRTRRLAKRDSAGPPLAQRQAEDLAWAIEATLKVCARLETYKDLKSVHTCLTGLTDALMAAAAKRDASTEVRTPAKCTGCRKLEGNRIAAQPGCPIHGVVREGREFNRKGTEMA
jgi:ParB/RepB/Spo0J family partition protein